MEHHADALESLNKAIALVPNDAFAFQERGNLLMRLNRHADAVADFSRALAVRPDDPDLLYSRGNTHSILKNYPETIRDCTRLLQIQPDYPYARGVLVHSKLQCCDWTGLDDQQREISLGIAGGKRVVSPFNHKALSDSPEEQLQCASNWVRHECPPTRPLWQGESYKHDRIRLAYLSADLNNTAVATLMAGVFEHHNRTRFAPIAVSFGPDSPTPMRARLIAAFEAFHDVREKSDQDIAIQLHALGIDIAVDLMGFTGACRPRIFAARPAPVQVNFVGFPGTMGASYMDYILADRIVIPAADATYYSEKIVYLPDCYQPNDDKRRVADKVPTRSEAGLPEQGFVFCCFNNSYKIMPDEIGRAHV